MKVGASLNWILAKFWQLSSWNFLDMSSLHRDWRQSGLDWTVVSVLVVVLLLTLNINLQMWSLPFEYQSAICFCFIEILPTSDTYASLNTWDWHWFRSQTFVNSLAPGRFEQNFRLSSFQANFSDWWPRYLLWNCTQMNATGPCQW